MVVRLWTTQVHGHGGRWQLKSSPCSVHQARRRAWAGPSGRGQSFLIHSKLLSVLAGACCPEWHRSSSGEGCLEGATSDQPPAPHFRSLQCVNELNQWLSALRKVSINNTGLLGSYHPGVFRGDKWSCCHQKDKTGGSEGLGPAGLHLSTAGSRHWSWWWGPWALGTRGLAPRSCC